ncbi:hypothetical protein AUC61_24005 [Pseudomonas sp. S25]|uniref:Uncharacterized protein n=1 Tax=Pseudomonas maioricensis TaxID=1766623 RepID=A0ABS9ZPU9_9PSED|nr:hypothetical protein [Pseudomonas sp. S25]MCI8212600.1 hypothetical protein [Pseudomonas sp. S25]
MTQQELDAAEFDVAFCMDKEPLKNLLEHTKELRAFVLILTDYHAMPGPTAEKTAQHYDVVRRAIELRDKMHPQS